MAVDIFQQIRTSREDFSYANDYEDIGQLKALADELGITILLVHHNRKMRDSDPLNNPSGTTGISGALDTILVLGPQQTGGRLRHPLLYRAGRSHPAAGTADEK